MRSESAEGAGEQGLACADGQHLGAAPEMLTTSEAQVAMLRLKMRMQERALTRAGLGLAEEPLIRKPSLHAHPKSPSKSPQRPSPIRSLRSPMRRKEASDDTWESVVDKSKARIQSAIDGLHLVLGKLRQDSESSVSTPTRADESEQKLKSADPSRRSGTPGSMNTSALSAQKTRVLFAPSQGVGDVEDDAGNDSTSSTPRSSRLAPEQDSPSGSDLGHTRTPERASNQSVVRSLMQDLSDAATSDADDEVHVSPSKDWRKWRADAEKSARLGEELQQIVVDQDRRITDLQAQQQRTADDRDQKQAEWREERLALQQQARQAKEDLVAAKEDLALARAEVEVERSTLRASVEAVAEQLRSAAEQKLEVEKRLREEVESWKQQTMLWADTGAQLKTLLSERDSELEELRAKVGDLKGQLSHATAAASVQAAAAQQAAQVAQERAQALEQDVRDTRAALDHAQQVWHDEQHRQQENQDRLQTLLQKQEQERVAEQELGRQALQELDEAREREIEQLRAEFDRLSRAHSHQQQQQEKQQQQTRESEDTVEAGKAGETDARRAKDAAADATKIDGKKFCGLPNANVHADTTSIMPALARKWAPNDGGQRPAHSEGMTVAETTAGESRDVMLRVQQAEKAVTQAHDQTAHVVAAAQEQDALQQQKQVLLQHQLAKAQVEASTARELLVVHQQLQHSQQLQSEQQLAAARALLEKTQKQLAEARKQGVAASATVHAAQAMRGMQEAVVQREQQRLDRIGELEQALAASRAHCLQLQQVLRRQARASALRSSPRAMRGGRTHAATRSAAFVAQACADQDEFSADEFSAEISGNLCEPGGNGVSQGSLEEVEVEASASSASHAPALPAASLDGEGAAEGGEGSWCASWCAVAAAPQDADQVAQTMREHTVREQTMREALSGPREERKHLKHLRLQINGSSLQREAAARRHWQAEACRLRATLAAERTSLRKAQRHASTAHDKCRLAELETQELKGLIFCPFEWPLSVPRGVCRWRRSQRKEAFKVTSEMTRIIRFRV